jgi:hypothetical protein
MCFQWMILACETYKLWMNKFCMISIIKSWNAKFVMNKNNKVTTNKDYILKKKGTKCQCSAIIIYSKDKMAK